MNREDAGFRLAEKGEKMKTIHGFILALVVGGLAVFGMPTEARAAEAIATETPPISVGSFRDAEAGLTPAERAGREIWFNATAGNARFFTDVFQRRIGVAIDWFRIPGVTGREDRFKLWGLTTDPTACGLDFGTATSALGLRKVPNPRFDKAAWLPAAIAYRSHRPSRTPQPCARSVVCMRWLPAAA